jgi:sulfite reductase subunit B
MEEKAIKTEEINPYIPIKAEILEIIDETPTIKTFTIKPEKPLRFRTGQFIELTYPGYGEAPFTPSSDPGIEEKFDVTIMKVGVVTEALHNAKEGALVGVRGPYGNGYPVDEFRGKEVYVIGGGVGFAPLRSLLYALIRRKNEFKKIDLRYGTRTPDDIVYKNLIKEWQENKSFDVKLTVDKGDENWQGNVGVVTTILNDLKPDNAICCVCGPPIMMKFTTLKLLDLGFKEDSIYLSLEKYMSCGIGKCGHCRIGYYYVCKDGPVFKYSQVKGFHELWD